MLVAEPNPSASVQPARKVVIPHQPRWFQRLAAALIFLLVKGVSLTLRYRWTDRSGVYANGDAGPVIFCVWHNRLALCMEAYFGYVRKRNTTPGMAAMVSASKDGALLASVLEAFGVQPARGSSSRRGSQALLELTTWADRGYDLAITPDGPRGPRYIVQDGVLSLAQVTGLPIVPFSYNLSWKITVKSWDRFQIPLPFSRVDFFMEKPVRVPRECPDEQRKALRAELESVLKSVVRD
jgi:lysophospholipid acyltransferase (LPLAT)-like uncharacterized protein